MSRSVQWTHDLKISVEGIKYGTRQKQVWTLPSTEDYFTSVLVQRLLVERFVINAIRISGTVYIM